MHSKPRSVPEPSARAADCRVVARAAHFTERCSLSATPSPVQSCAGGMRHATGGHCCSQTLQLSASVAQRSLERGGGRACVCTDLPSRTIAPVAVGPTASASMPPAMLALRRLGAAPEGRRARGDAGSSLRVAMGSCLARLLPGDSGTKPLSPCGAEPASAQQRSQHLGTCPVLR